MDQFVRACVAFGLKPYKLNANRTELILSKKNASLSLILVLVNLGYLVLQGSFNVGKSEFREWVYLIRQIIYRVFCLTSHTIYLSNSKEIFRIFLELKKIAKKIKLDLTQKTTHLILLELLIYFSTIFYMYSLTFWGLYLHIQTRYKHVFRENLGHALHCLTNTIIYLIELIFVNLMIFLAVSTEKLNLNISNLNPNLHPKKSEFLLRELLSFSGKLSEISSKIHAIFSFQLLLTMLIIFIEITFSIYFITITIFNFNADSIGVKIYTLYLMPWTLLLLVKLFAINSVCTLVEVKAKFTAVCVHKLVLKQKRLDAVLVDIVENFSLGCKLNPVCFTAANFFKLRTEFIIEMIGSVISYLLILVNFHYMQH